MNSWRSRPGGSGRDHGADPPGAAENADLRAVLARHKIREEMLTAEDLLMMLAEDDALAHLREVMSSQFVNRLTVNLESGRVVDRGRIGQALAAQMPVDPEDDATTTPDVTDASLPAYLRRVVRRSQAHEADEMLAGRIEHIA